MDGMGLGMLAEQLGDLELGELLHTPPPGLDEAIAISKLKQKIASATSAIKSVFGQEGAQLGAVMAVSESSRLHASLKKESILVKRLIVNQILPKIPPAFVKNFNGEPPCRCALIGPSATWPVELEKREDGLFFHDLGWQGFVKDHALETGDFLVFIYNDGSDFNVTVFDHSLCEKDIEAAKRRSAGSSVSLGNKGNQAGAKNEIIELESENKNEDCGNNHASLVNKGNQAAVKVEADSETERDNEESATSAIMSGQKKPCRRSCRRNIVGIQHVDQTREFMF